VDFVSYSVTDMERSEAFYRDVLGMVALAVEDVGAAAEELRGKGVKIAMDPDGNHILIHQRKNGSFG
jgi:catechol 2,3-dioxygenase-like lactoylglutathione lyase family enzyme